MQRLLYIIEALVNVRKLFQIKRYSVVFFDMKNLPEEGALITVGKMQAVFHPIDAPEPVADEDVAELESAMMDSMQLKEKDEEEVPQNLVNPGEKSWNCRKCKLDNKIPIITPTGTKPGETIILQCEGCGFRVNMG